MSSTKRKILFSTYKGELGRNLEIKRGDRLLSQSHSQCDRIYVIEQGQAVQQRTFQ